MKEIVGNKDDPVARLCPLGWTAVGKIEQRSNVGHHHIGFSHTFRIHVEEATTNDVPNECSDLNSTLKRFWDLESVVITPTRESLMTPEEKLAWGKVSQSMKFDGKHYEVAVPWKENRPNLPTNLPMAKQRLLSTEKKLLKNKEVALAYQQVLNGYLEKQYIRRVPKDEEKPQQEWLLPHFPVVRPERASTKILSKLRNGDKAGFHVCKWVSNRKEVLEDIPAKDCSSNVSLEKNELPTTKTLGIRWDAGDDEFLFDYSSLTDDFHYTKRNVLKKTASLFDPLGFLSPFIIKAKLYLQQAWLEALDWDDELPYKLKNQWKNWFNELHLLQEIKIPRCLKNSNLVTSVTLHSFSDASEKEYAAVVYARYEYEDKSVTTQLIASKTRLSPLKAISIPRLELMGALIGVRLTKQVSTALEIPVKDATFWVDSMNVLHWIHGRSRDYKPFVAHRVGEIADYGSRGMNVSEMKNNQQCWFGPEFLKKSKDAWPEEKIEIELNSVTCKELKVEARKQERVRLKMTSP
ncbi:Hypothetical predicted protein [Paramuricea clavata]|uniref:Uncharacterized protein n=1 Tax=Paramuricea clavata TaxID=317549 RepID=A0A7D9DBE7_PARCT|nr:Hypothetical predicted protein [Paramuricea clavata]